MDPPSIRNGEFIVENAATAESLRILREDLKTRLPDITFSITHFVNWGSTVSILLLYVKPRNRQEVCDIIKVAKELDIKVGSVMYLTDQQKKDAVGADCSYSPARTPAPPPAPARGLRVRDYSCSYRVC